MDTELRTWTVMELLEAVMDPNTRVGAAESKEVEFVLNGGPIVVRRRDLSPGRADLEVGETVANLTLATRYVIKLVNNDEAFTSSVHRGAEVIKFSWFTR